jgi:hypothetical protein
MVSKRWIFGGRPVFSTPRPDGTPMRVRLSQDQDLARHSSIMNAKEDIKNIAAFFISEPSVVSKLEPNV